jgi:hypothetical protein
MFTPTGETIPSVSLKDWERFLDQVGASYDFGDEWFTYSAIKLGVDGGMTLRTAYMRDPYPDDPSYRGFRTIEPDRLNQLVAIERINGYKRPTKQSFDIYHRRARDHGFGFDLDILSFEPPGGGPGRTHHDSPEDPRA